MEHQKPKLRCSVGVTAYNEETNIGPLLDALLNQHLHDTEITEIIVVASGCTDNTVPIIERVAAENPAIKLIVQPKREGKTAAINLFLANAKEDICVLESGDTLPAENSVEHMVRMFADPTVGMVGAHKIPVNTPDHLIGLFTHLRLRLEHQLCLEIPRLGEMIAFRKVIDRIPPDVAMDEAFVEAFVVQRGMSVRYAPDAVVYNTGPDTIQRLRHPAAAQPRRAPLSQVEVRLCGVQHAEHPRGKDRPEGDLGRDPAGVGVVPARRAGDLLAHPRLV